MYLSRIRLTESIARHSQLGALLQRNSYGMHSLLWDLFEKGERFLFREERSQEQMGTARNLPLYYVLSAREPLTQSPLFEVNCKRFEPHLQAGDQLNFRLRANPTMAKRVEGAKNSKRHDVVMNAQRDWLLAACTERSLVPDGKKGALKSALQAHQDFHGKEGAERLEAALAEASDAASLQWLTGRGEKNGFQILKAEATGYRWNALPEKGREAGFSSMDYEGVLSVTDPNKFVACLASGLGPAKAFGCGLLLIRRL